MKVSYHLAMALFLPILLALAQSASSSEYEEWLNPFVDTWKKYNRPGVNDKEAREKWDYFARRSIFNWVVYKENGIVKAKLARHRHIGHGDAPAFLKDLDQTTDIYYHQVSTGWIINSSRWECMNDFSWYSENGKAKRPIFTKAVNDIIDWDDYEKSGEFKVRLKGTRKKQAGKLPPGLKALQQEGGVLTYPGFHPRLDGTHSERRQYTLF